MRLLLLSALILAALLLSACASESSVPESSSDSDQVNVDPWEPANRAVFVVNHGLDSTILKPIAKGYKKVLPNFLRIGVSNFFSNLRTPLSVVNNILQGKGAAALSDTGRLLLNTTVGIGGLMDPATSAGLEKRNEDFGQTLAVWGVPDGPFVMVPLLGPRTLRDAFAIPLNLFAHPLYHYDNAPVRDKLWGLGAIQVRARLLAADDMINNSYDPYITIREAYLQNRRYLIYDGDPPDNDQYLLDDFEEEETLSAN